MRLPERRVTLREPPRPPPKRSLRAHLSLRDEIEASPALRVALWLLGMAAAAYMLLYAGLAVFRVPYPFELEWLEGSVVDVVHRLLLGQKIYVEPSVEFASHAYTPLYFYVSAAASKAIRKLAIEISADVRHDARGLVDAFLIPDAVLAAPIGR